MLTLLPLLAGLAQAQEADRDPRSSDPSGRFDEPFRPVVGGEPAASGSWPAVAALAYNGFVACSGVLIHPEWVLTAGHCAPNITEIYLDTTDLAAPAEVHAIDDFIPHADAFQTFDVALAHLANPSEIAPVPLALDCIAEGWIQPGGVAEIVGFGSTDAFAQQPATGLNHASVTIEDPECTDEYRGCNPAAMPAGELIAGGGGVDSCTGDSGAPLLLQADGRSWLAGTTARAAIPAPEPCGHGGIYVRADAVVDWIEDVTGLVMDRPSCDGLNRPPVAEADPIHTSMNTPGLTAIRVSDEPDQGFAVELSEPPEHGWVALSGDQVSYMPDLGYVGDDSLRVRVTDDGNPPASVVVEIPVTVDPVEEASGCGCAQSPARPAAVLFLLALVTRRRQGA